MKPTRLIGTLATLVALGASAAARAGETIEFKPEPGLALRKTIVTEQYLSLQDIVLEVDGTPQTAMNQFEVTSTQTLEVTDTYLKVLGGRPTALRRKFERIAFDGAAQLPGRESSVGQSSRVEGKSGLQGHSVVFTQVGDGYGRYFDAGEPKEELLRDLREDLDFRALLPSGPVEVGVEWELAPATLLDLLQTGGDLQVVATVPGEVAVPRLVNAGIGGSLSRLVGELTDGQGRAKLEGVETRDGARVALIGFTFQLNSKRDQTKLGKAQLSADELRRGVGLDSAEVGLGLSGRGQLVWLLEEGHARSLRLQANGRLDRGETFDIPKDTRRGKMKRNMGLDISLDLNASFARP